MGNVIGVGVDLCEVELQVLAGLAVVPEVGDAINCWEMRGRLFESRNVELLDARLFRDQSRRKRVLDSEGLDLLSLSLRSPVGKQYEGYVECSRSLEEPFGVRVQRDGRWVGSMPLQQRRHFDASRCAEYVEWLTVLDRYYTDHLHDTGGGPWLGDERTVKKMDMLFEIVSRLFAPLDGPRRPLTEWFEPVLEVHETSNHTVTASVYATLETT